MPEQLQASRDLVNEGLSGLFPRARVLLQVGAAVPTAFGGLIAVAVCVFAVLALGLEDKFIHGEFSSSSSSSSSSSFEEKRASEREKRNYNFFFPLEKPKKNETQTQGASPCHLLRR